MYRRAVREAETDRTVRDDLPPRRPGTRSHDRRHHHADLPDLDLRAGGARPAQGLRVRAHAESDALGARGESRRDRRRQERLRVRLGHGRHQRDHVAAEERRPRRRLRQRLRRNVPAVRAGVDAAISCRSPTSTPADLDRHRARVHAGDAAAVRRNAEQPGDAADRSRARPPISRTGTARGWSSTTPSRARACSGRSSSAPTSSRTARRNI